MRIELLQTLLALIVAALGGVIVWDSRSAPDAGIMRERRRRMRAAIDPGGELLAGIGTMLVGIGIIPMEWRFATLWILAGLVGLVIGAIRNRAFIKESIFFRGAARRGLDRPEPPRPDRWRIR